MKEYLFASLNEGKIREVQRWARAYGMTVWSAHDLLRSDRAAGQPPIIDEDGASYYDNARKKAIGFANWSGMVAIGDDSGLEVDALGGAPGMFSARYAGMEATDRENRRKLLAEMQGVASRTARYRSVLALSVPDSNQGRYEATLEGEIGLEERGAGGFGYDSLFVLPEHGITLAECKQHGIAVETHRMKSFRMLFAGTASDQS